MSRPTRGNNERLRALFNAGEELSYAAIVKHLGVSTRQAHRLVRGLIADGMELATRRDGRRQIFSLPEELREHGVRVALAEEQIVALAVAADAVRSSLGPTPLGAALDAGVRSLLEQLPGDVLLVDLETMKDQWHFAANPSAAIDPAIFSAVMRAIGDCATLAVDYYSAGRMAMTTRRLDPYGFAAPGGSWLLVAYCHTRRGFRTFSVADIRAAAPTGNHFLRDDTFDLDRYFADQFGGVGGNTRHDVTLRVAPDCVAGFRRKTYHPSQILEPHDDGTAIVRFRVAGLEDIRAFVMSWGVGVSVVEPEELRAMVREEMVGMWREYE